MFVLQSIATCLNTAKQIQYNINIIISFSISFCGNFCVITKRYKLTIVIEYIISSSSYPSQATVTMMMMVNNKTYYAKLVAMH